MKREGEGGVGVRWRHLQFVNGIIAVQAARSRLPPRRLGINWIDKIDEQRLQDCWIAVVPALTFLMKNVLLSGQRVVGTALKAGKTFRGTSKNYFKRFSGKNLWQNHSKVLGKVKKKKWKQQSGIHH